MGNKSVILQLHPETLRWIREEAQADMQMLLLSNF